MRNKAIVFHPQQLLLPQVVHNFVLAALGTHLSHYTLPTVSPSLVLYLPACPRAQHHTRSRSSSVTVWKSKEQMHGGFWFSLDFSFWIPSSLASSPVGRVPRALPCSSCAHSRCPRLGFPLEGLMVWRRHDAHHPNPTYTPTPPKETPQNHTHTLSSLKGWGLPSP